MSDLMVLNMGELALPFDEAQAEELTKDLTAGLGGGFKRAPRLTMGNSGDWELVTPEGEVVDLGRQPNIVIVDQRNYNSRIHYENSFDDQKAAGEFEAPDCYSTDGQTPDSTVENPLCDNCKECAYNKISKNYVNGNLACSTYRRLICVLVREDGTFSDPCVLEPKYKSLTDDVVVKGRYGSYGWYMKVLTSQVHPVTKKPMPIPTQSVVTTCMALPKMQVATMKFGIAATPNGGYWTLNKEQMAEILRLKDSEEVKSLLEPFNAAFNNPSSAGRIPVVNVEVPSVEEVAEEVQAEPAKKAPPAKKTRKVVLGMEHPDVVNTTEYDYAELKEWAADATDEEVREFLAENFPQALEPVEVAVEEEVKAEPAKKSPPKRQAPAKKAEAPVATEEVVTNEGSVTPEQVKEAQKLADDLDEFDD